MEKLRIGVVGLRFGRNIAHTLFDMPEVELAAVADRHPRLPEGLEPYAASLGARAYTDGVEMMRAEALDGICICTSPGAREPLVAHAATAGIPMFVEKPWAPNPQQAQHLASLCREHDAKVMVGFSFRFLPAIIKLRELMHGELGRGWMLNGDYTFQYQPAVGSWLWDPRNGGGLINENSCHLFDAVCYLMGRPVSVMADAGIYMGNPSEDAATVLLHFEGGGMAALTIGGIASGADIAFPRIDVITEHGQAHLEGRHHIWEHLTWSTREGPELHTLKTQPEALGRMRYEPALRHFVECIRTGSKPSASIEDGLMSVAVAAGVYEAARTGQKVALRW
ncbi:MAG: Gfo/Idh/MocA family oxidoreductase [Anaerolineae bacterium]|nr:Gfo/Idh/MocA family oxidoreductase [Anaerolineae bacterium]